MKKRKIKKETIKTPKEKMVRWLKEPENIVLCVLLIAVTIIGIIDDNLLIIIIVFTLVFLYGRILGWIFYLKDKIFK